MGCVEQFACDAVESHLWRGEGIARRRGSLVEAHRQPHGERASSAELADDGDFASEQLRQLLDDREAQARSAVFPRHRVALTRERVPLPEFFEDHRLLVERDADSRILDHNLEKEIIDAVARDSARDRLPA